MGSSQSTRNISVVNENEDNVIKVSDGVVRRLFGDESAAPAGGAVESQPAAVVAQPAAYIPGYNPISTAQVRRLTSPAIVSGSINRNCHVLSGL